MIRVARKDRWTIVRVSGWRAHSDARAGIVPTARHPSVCGQSRLFLRRMSFVRLRPIFQYAIVFRAHVFLLQKSVLRHDGYHDNSCLGIHCCIK